MLLETPGIGWRTLASILRRNSVARRSADEFLRLSPEQMAEEYGIRKAAAARLCTGIRSQRERAEEQAKWLARSGVNLLTILDATYPPQLSQRLEDAPPVIFAYGNLGLLARRKFAVANSNGAPEEALAAADSATETAIESGFVLVTG